MAAIAIDEQKELVRRSFEETWSEDNDEAIDELVAEDFVLHDPAYPETVSGRDGYKEFVETYRTAFPADTNFTLEDVIGEGDVVAVRWIGHGTHENEFMGIEPTHEEIEVAGQTMARIEDEQIAEMWTSYDALGLLQQIGGVPERPTE